MRNARLDPFTLYYYIYFIYYFMTLYLYFIILNECAQMNGAGRAVIRFLPGSTAIHATASFNGVTTASVVVDTGATWVGLTKSFADRLGVIPRPNSKVFVRTAAGLRQAQMATIPSIKIQGARAENVPAVILEDWGGNADVLLGLSFLSRFTIKMDPKAGQLVLAARK